MANILGRNPVSERELYYFRQRLKNRIFQSAIAFFAEKAESQGLTKREVALRLSKDPAQITRWFSGPGNWTLETVSDLLLAMDSELDCRIEPLHLGSAESKVQLEWDSDKPRTRTTRDPAWQAVEVA